MKRLDVYPDHALLVRILRTPSELATLSAETFSRAMDAAEQARLLGWLVTRMDEQELPRNPPSWLADRVLSARALVGEYDRSLRWEIDRLDRAFQDADVRWILLKGGAYLAADLPPGRGRRVADVDVLVPHALLVETETVLKAHGWRFGEIDPYDERYYRTWMHELPPMVHDERESIVDVHHAILPRTGRLQPSSARLIDQAIDVEPTGVRVLCPAHMVLHAAAHLFHDGEIAGAIRDLADLDGLLRTFSRQPEFWDELIREAPELELKRPAYYAIRYTQRLFDTPVPSGVTAKLDAWSPPGPIRWLMDVLVARALPGSSGHASSSAAFALYVRSHWLRMPPWLLVQHLARKSMRPR